MRQWITLIEKILDEINLMRDFDDSANRYRQEHEWNLENTEIVAQIGSLDLLKELNEKLNLKPIKDMDNATRHKFLEFIYLWLNGHYMQHADETPLSMWRQISKYFPPKLSGNVPLYRLMTIPIQYADQEKFNIKPAKGPVSSWTKTLGGLDCVAGVASDLVKNKEHTVRIAVICNIPANLILATPSSIKQMILTLSHDYIERYRNNDDKWTNDMNEFGSSDSGLTFLDVDEIEYVRSIISRYKGGWLRQHECIVETPEKIICEKVRIYRLGGKTIRYGNDDPHY